MKLVTGIENMPPAIPSTANAPMTTAVCVNEGRYGTAATANIATAITIAAGTSTRYHLAPLAIKRGEQTADADSHKLNDNQDAGHCLAKAELIQAQGIDNKDLQRPGEPEKRLGENRIGKQRIAAGLSKRND